MNIQKLVTFSRMLNEFALIERIVPRPGSDRGENDMEHSFHLALLAWYIIDSQKLDLDLATVFRYALAHDLVEVHAGDTYVWSKDDQLHATKKEREAAAAKQLAEEFPEFPDLHQAIAEYEAGESREARFVYALDKIVPIILIRDDNGNYWQKYEVTLEMILNKKKPQVACSPEIEPYFDELYRLLEAEGLTKED